MKKCLILLLSILVLLPLVACERPDNQVFAKESWEATDPVKWEAQNISMDWVTPDIVFVGHLATTLTQPLMPDDQIITVKSTKGFLESGWVKVRSESINYKSKTNTTFIGLERSGDIKTPVRNGTVVARLERGDYQIGTIEKYTIRYHSGSGESEQTDMLNVTTWPDETKAPMPLKKKLSDLKSVVLISSIAEELRATRYNAETNEIMVEGFKADKSRVLTIRYQGQAEETWYYIEAKPPQKFFEDYSPPPAGFEKWVTISTPSSISVGAPSIILIKSGSTIEIEVSLLVPKDAAVPSQRWMFWIDIGELAPKGITTTTSMAVTWLVNMGR